MSRSRQLSRENSSLNSHIPSKTFTFGTCDLCSRQTGDHFCIQCNQYLCDHCQSIHLKSTVSRGHRIKPPEVLLTEAKRRQCELHPQQVIENYCMECSQFLCRKCLNGIHKFHKYRSLPAASEIQQNLLKDFIEYVNKETEVLQEHIKTSDTFQKTYQYKEKERVAEIKKAQEELKSRIDAAADELINEMKERRDDNLKEMAENRSMLAKMTEHGKRLKMRCQQTIDEIDEQAAPLMTKGLVKEVCNFQSPTKVHLGEYPVFKRALHNPVAVRQMLGSFRQPVRNQDIESRTTCRLALPFGMLL
ncbi:E3 ubiquitin-protein ligase TRIM33-like [Mytilus edulis]|uniref:E3 ubiquitin-protein ligase TRIM33-like n=1 Tax=Mytilus edulis TaxID=6550 RepID=UPI0039EED5AA